MFLESGGLGGADYPKPFSEQKSFEAPRKNQNLSDDEIIKDWENTLSQNQREFFNRAKKSNKYNVEHTMIYLHGHMRSNRLRTEDIDRFISYVRKPSRNISDDQAIRLWNSTGEFMSNGISFSDAFNSAIRGEHVSDSLLSIEEGDTKEITNAIFASIDKGNNIFDPTFIIPVEDISWEDSTLSDGFSWNSLPLERKDKIISLVKKRCEEKVCESIEAYMSKGTDNTINSLVRRLFPSNGQPSPDDQKLLNYFIIYIQADNYQQPTENRTNIQDNEALKENFKAFCSTIGYRVDDVDKDLLKRWKEKREQEYKENRQRIENRNKAINERRTAKKLDNVGMHEDKENKSIDLKTATGAEIAKNAKLGRNVHQKFKHNLDGLEGKKDPRLKNISFNIAWTNFLKNNSFLFKKDGKDIGISSILTENKMHEIFDINSDTPSVNVSKLDEFMGKIENSYSVDEKEKIRTTLESFAREFDNILGELTDVSNNIEDHIHETVNNHAIGAVIDNVKNIFLGMGEKLKQGTNFQGFEFSENPAEIINENNLIISGTLNGATVKIRYNLSSGQLFMNSFITEINGNPSKITIGGNEPNDSIGSFTSFNDILEDYYKSPTPSTEDNSNNGPEVGYKPLSQGNKGNMISVPRSPLNSQKTDNSEEIRKENSNNFNKILNQNIESIGVAVQNRMQNQSMINSVVTQFLKTFNILRDGQTDPIGFEEGGNLFKALQIIKNSDTATLVKFQEIMEKLMEYGGLIRGKNNDTQNPDWENNIFPSEDDDDGNLFVKAMKNFEGEKEKISYKQNNQFGRDDILGFADIIQKLAIGDPPDRKLSQLEMDTFMENINNCSGLEASLNNALNNID